MTDPDSDADGDQSSDQMPTPSPVGVVFDETLTPANAALDGAGVLRVPPRASRA